MKGLKLSVSNVSAFDRTFQKLRVHLPPISVKSQDEKVKLLIMRDLMRLNWSVETKKEHVIISPPEYYDKETIRASMSFNRMERIEKDKQWIAKHTELLRQNLASGQDVLESEIRPIIEVCETQKQRDLFRMCRYYWSSAYSDYVGRRIKIIIRDDALPNKPIIGIAALGSPIIHIPERDNWIGWDKTTRTKNLIYTMDAYVLGSMPPYNELLGGKLVSYILASNEIREIYRKKYIDKETLIEKRVANDLVGIFTTSLYGKSAQYDRISYEGRKLYVPIGQTKGFGSLHLSQETFEEMVNLLDSHEVPLLNSFGAGPSWRMRVIRAAGDILKFNTNILLNHSFRRNVYAVPLIKNFEAFLCGKETTPQYYDYPLVDVVTYWQKRWLSMRKRNRDVIDKVAKFKPEKFTII